MSTVVPGQFSEERVELIKKVMGRKPEDMTSNWTEEDEDGRKLTLFRYQGKLYPAFGDLTFGQLKDLTIRDDDVFIVGYPKTGCHWTFEVLLMILQGEAKLSERNKLQTYVDVVNPTMLSTLPSPRVLNSHLLFQDLPRQVVEKKTKVVLTVRNPKDTAVSYYNHHTKIPQYGYDGTFNKWFPLYLDGRVDYGSYFDYYKSWDKVVKTNPDLPILVLSYEDMKEDLPREIQRLSEFLGISVTDNLVAGICDVTQVNKMKDDYNNRGWRFKVRKGQVGDWKNWLTVAQSEAIDDVIKDKMADLSIYKPRYTLP